MRYQVAIIGGGPVGVALAIDLGQRGISCVVVERRREPQPIPKGQNLTNRSMELFHAWGCVDEVRAARVMPPGYPIGGVTAYGNLMSEHWYANSGSGSRGAAVSEYFFEANERLPQYCTEAVLRERLGDLPSVDARFGWTAIDVEQDGDGCRATVAPLDEQGETVDAAAELIEAEYLVGCDGGRSLVRERMGIGHQGRSYDQRMVLAVFRSREFHEALDRFPDCTTYRVLKPELEGFWQFFGRVDVGESFFFHAPLPPGAEADAAAVHRLVQQAAGFEFAAEFDHVGAWDLRIIVAAAYRRDRVFIAGDAAHQHPPYGGFGLNTGLEDAANLGWKLAARLQGWGGEALLASYDEERRPIFVETGELMIAGGIERDRAFLERYHPDRDRDEFERAWGALAGASGDIPTQPYVPNYAGSSVVAGPPGASCTIQGTHEHTARAGYHLSPRSLSSGRNVFEELGSGFTLLSLDAGDRSVGEAAGAVGVPLTVLRDTLDGERAAYGARLILVRPDQHLAWAGDVPPADPAALLRVVTGWQ